MTKYEAKPMVIEATQWFKSGDHPKDDREEFIGSDGKPFLGEGKVVRYYRRPDVDGQTECKDCGRIMHDHGWIDKLEEGETVCPGDFVIVGWNGLYYTLKPDVFDAKFKKAKPDVRKENDDIVTSDNEFEHLLGCLDNVRKSIDYIIWQVTLKRNNEPSKCDI